MSWFDAMVFGIVQGLTEFLPVSSSAHLDLYRFVSGVAFGPGEEVGFFAILHLGSLAAILLLFRQDLGRLARAAPGMVKKLLTFRMGTFRLYEKLLFMLLVATLPAGLIGVLFEKQIEVAFGSVRVVGLCLVLTGIILWLTRWAPDGLRGIRAMTPLAALGIGLAQAVAILPGISRSGSTIATALFLDVDREIAARFSFLLSVPVVAGAGLLKLAKLGGAGLPAAMGDGLLVGVLFAFVGSYAALRVLLEWIRAGKLHWFSWYLWVLGCGAIASQELGTK